MNNQVDIETQLFGLYASTGDPFYRNQIILNNLGLVSSIAKRFLRSGQPIEDLIQEGTIGLIKAVDNFDPTEGVQFNTYATQCIDGAIRHYIRDFAKLIQEPGWHQLLRYRILKALENIEKDGRAATPQEIAEALNLNDRTVEQVLASGILFETESLDEPEYGLEGEIEFLGDSVAVDHRWAERQDTILTVRDAISQLPHLEQRVVDYFFYQQLTKAEIARKFGFSAAYAGFLLKQALRRLETILNPAIK